MDSEELISEAKEVPEPEDADESHGVNVVVVDAPP